MLYRQIILEWGQDTESGVWGLGYSPDNGKNFYVLNTTHGRKYRAEDGNRLYPYISDQIQDKIDTVVAPAKSAADSAQSAADAAVASAQVTSDAVSAIASATAEAKQGANDAMSRALSAWDVAIGAKSAVTDFDPLLKSAQSDAGKALTQIADTASALSDAKTAIEQNKNAITLKADKTDVDKINGTVSQLQSTLTVQAGQIQEKVTSSQVTGMLTGYATQEYTQSLVTQESNEWNLNLTNLKTDVNAIKTTGGGVNLQQGTGDCSLPISGNGTNVTIEKFDDYTNMIHASGNSSGFYIGYTSGRFIPEVGKTYTFSCDIKGQGQISGGGLRYEGGDDGTMGAITLTDNWTRISNTIHVNAISGTWVIYLNPINGKVDFYVKHIMIEEGIVAHPWSPAPSDMATVTSVTNLSATVDGIKSTVATKADQSTVTQLSNLVQSKVSSGDFTSTTTQLKNLINQRVQVGDVISQINQEAGGDTLIQVSNGKKSLILDAGNTVFTGKAWIPVAAIANLTADQVQAGTLSGSKVHAGDNSGNAIDMGALSAGYVGFHAYANNGDNTYIDYNGIHNYGASYDTRIQQGKITTNYLTVNGGGMIDFRDSNGTGMVVQGSTLTFDVGNTPAGYLSYNGMPVAEIPDGSGGNELAIRYGLSAAIIPNDNSGAQATFSGAAQKIGYMTGTNQGKKMLSGLEVHSNNHHWFGAVNSDATLNRIEINSNDGVNLAWHDQTHFWISDGKAKLYKDNNDSQTATELEVHGWAWVNGWVEAAGHSQHSTLSSKTRIEEADPDYMLDLVNNTDLTTFAFKSEVAEGLVVRHIGPIIDDVNDVAQYRTPAEFIAPTKTARDDDNMIGALFGAVQALTKRIKKLEDKLNG